MVTLLSTSTTLIEVKDKNSAREFINLPKSLYQNDPNWISPLDSDIEAVFDPRKNDFHSHGVCTRWILVDESRQTVGRIAAFIDYEKTNSNSLPVGGVGFFECINNKNAAHLLFDTSRKWLEEKGMRAMDGPINFGENDKYWGLLVEGFKPPALGMNYNPPYYVELFESYGFKGLYDQYTNFLDARVPLPERFTKISDWVMKKPEYTFEHFSISRKEKYFRDFQEIYNDAWNELDNFTEISLPTIRETFRQMLPLLDEKIIWYAYYNNEPVAVVVCLPDVNQLLKYLNGKLDLWGKLKFFWYKKTTTIDRLRIIVMGCKKKFQNRGIESALIRCLQIEVLPRNTIKGVELAWVADWNQKMLALHEATGAKRDKVHRTYRYNFEDSEFRSQNSEF